MLGGPLSQLSRFRSNHELSLRRSSRCRRRGNRPRHRLARYEALENRRVLASVVAEVASLAEVAQAQATAPVFSIAPADAEKLEGDFGPTLFSFTVTRSGQTNVSAAVEYVVSGSGSNPASS